MYLKIKVHGEIFKFSHIIKFPSVWFNKIVIICNFCPDKRFKHTSVRNLFPFQNQNQAILKEYCLQYEQKEATGMIKDKHFINKISLLKTQQSLAARGRLVHYSHHRRSCNQLYCYLEIAS